MHSIFEIYSANITSVLNKNLGSCTIITQIFFFFFFFFFLLNLQYPTAAYYGIILRTLGMIKKLAILILKIIKILYQTFQPLVKRFYLSRHPVSFLALLLCLWQTTFHLSPKKNNKNEHQVILQGIQLAVASVRARWR